MVKNQNIIIGIVAYPDAQKSAVYGLIDLFETANRFHQSKTVEGVKLNTRQINEDSYNKFSELDVVILPPSLARNLPVSDKKLQNGLNNFHQRGGLVCSVCAGAFLLADTGLLDGRTATTHWGLAQQFQSRFGAVLLDTNKLIIDDGDIITAGGIMAWMDLGLKLIDRYLGSEIMLKTANYLLVDPAEREQRFYSTFSPPLKHGDLQILKVQQWLQKNYTQQISVKDMTIYSTLNTRTFIRRFQNATQFSPSEYLQHLRIGKAREIIETTNRSIDQISLEIGYRDTGSFRRIFHKTIGLTPKEYRARFSTSLPR